MKLKKVILVIILIAIIVASVIAGVVLGKKNKTNNTDKIKVTASNFASYDFLRAIIGDSDNIELTFLLGPGKDAHSYDPSAQDIITIQNSDLFIYIGGEMEKWADRVLPTLDSNNTKIICVADDIKTIDEQEVDGAASIAHTHQASYPQKHQNCR